MKILKKYWIIAVLALVNALQSCSDDDGYSVGDIATDWVTVRVEGGAYIVLLAIRGEQCIRQQMAFGIILW